MTDAPREPQPPAPPPEPPAPPPEPPAPPAPPAGGPQGARPIVDRVRDIILRPKEEWPRIDAEPATIGGIYTNYVMILAAIPPLAMALGQLVFGYSFLGFTYRPPVTAVLGQAISSYVLSLVMVYVLALIIDALAPSFGGVQDRLKAFKVAAYSMTAAWLAGIFSLLPALSILGVLGLYSLYLLYLGLPRLMRVPEDKALGYVLVVIVIGIVLAVVVGAVAAMFAPTPTLGTITGPGMR